MGTTLFLAKVIGWYFVITSLFLLFRQQTMKTLMAEVLTDRALMFFIAIMTLILGLLLVISHNAWVMGWPVIVTIVAWLTLIGGILRLMVPELGVKVGRWWLKNLTYLYTLAVLLLVVGLYLLYRAYFNH
mgnify:CR=1 FL=1